MFIDAVHYAPHGHRRSRAGLRFPGLLAYNFSVRTWALLSGKRRTLTAISTVQKVRPASDSLPDRWKPDASAGVIAGIGAAVDYLRARPPPRCDATNRRSALLAAYRTTHQHETSLLTRLVAGLLSIPKLRFLAISVQAASHERCSTLSIRIGDHHPTEIAKFLGDRASSPGMEITCAEPDRAPRRRGKAVVSPHRPRALQHRGRSRPSADRAA